MLSGIPIIVAMQQDLYIGIDVGGTNIKCALVREQMVLDCVKLPTYAKTGYHASLEQIEKGIRKFGKSIRGIGIGIAGIIDSKRGIIRYSPNLPGWDNIPLATILRKKFAAPVSILNDVNAGCLGEWQYGAGQGHNDVFMLTVGTGVGGAAVCRGELQFGAHGFAGEFGHIIIRENGRRCACGNRGCLEGYVGSQPMVSLASRLMRHKRSSLKQWTILTPHIIAKEARKGDRVAREVFKKIGYFLGIGITSIIHLYDPEIVIVSGGVSKAGKIFFDPIRKTVQQHVIGAEYRNYKIVPSKLGDNAGVLGAVYYAQSVGRNL